MIITLYFPAAKGIGCLLHDQGLNEKAADSCYCTRPKEIIHHVIVTFELLSYIKSFLWPGYLLLLSGSEYPVLKDYD